MEVFDDVQGMRRKRIRGRFRATLAGLLELEVLRVRHKEMVETALGKRETPDRSVDPELQRGQRRYWVEENSFRLKLKRSLSQENVTDSGKAGTFSALKRAGACHSSEDLQQMYCPDRRTVTGFEDGQSRASSGFCGSSFGGISNSTGDAISCLSTSLASLSYRSTASDAGYGGQEDPMRSIFPKNRDEGDRMSGVEASAFSEEVVPEIGFLSVVDLYPDSHWPDVSHILQPQVVLEPSYRSDLKSRQGSEVYRYPSPLHAVALQSPLYAPKSPVKDRNKTRTSPPDASAPTSSFLRPDCVPMERGRCHPESTSMRQSSMSLPWLRSSWTGKHAHSENCRCVEIILKRAQTQPWSHTTATSGKGVLSWSRRSMASLHRTCSMGKSRVTPSYKSKLCQSRGTGASESEPAGSSEPARAGYRGRLGTHRNRARRHTAALTNLDMFRESGGASVPCGVLLDRRCSVRASDERSALV